MVVGFNIHFILTLSVLPSLPPSLPRVKEFITHTVAYNYKIGKQGVRERRKEGGREAKLQTYTFHVSIF